ncbi:PqqD family protein [Stygiolobus azoricus]|uniref:PqqD family peptide modification chaperone n=1 Tax=Stygiolobus azoricus TaxID=41675 RepID=A0A650CR96_9CREN|nr:PqqD family protein [Stygiolobus azoricus]QGR20346.1 PqqD family peptide modification chaperone [Stygiolobus azoricus]
MSSDLGPEKEGFSFDQVKDLKPQKIGEFIDKSEDEEGYIIKVSEDKVYELAPIAYYVWEMCDGNRTVTQIVNQISQEANLSPEQVREPIVMVLNELKKASLISM